MYHPPSLKPLLTLFSSSLFVKSIKYEYVIEVAIPKLITRASQCVMPILLLFYGSRSVAVSRDHRNFSRRKNFLRRKNFHRRKKNYLCHFQISILCSIIHKLTWTNSLISWSVKRMRVKDLIVCYGPKASYMHSPSFLPSFPPTWLHNFIILALLTLASVQIDSGRLWPWFRDITTSYLCIPHYWNRVSLYKACRVPWLYGAWREIQKFCGSLWNEAWIYVY